MKYQIEIAGKQYELIANPGHDGLELFHDGSAVEFDLQQIHPAGLYSMLFEGQQFRLWIEKKHDNQYRIKLNEHELEAEVNDQNRLLRKALIADDQDNAGAVVVRAPIPGLILGVEVTEGQEVATGDGLVIMEAMKMENEIKSPGPGTVQNVQAKPGDTIEKDTILLEIVKLGSEK